MRRYNHNFSKLLRITLRIFIFVFSFLLLMQCVHIMEPSFGHDSHPLKSNIISAACNHMTKSNLPILNYTVTETDGDKDNFILNTFLGNFPINSYVAAAKEDLQENVEDESTDSSLTFANGKNLILENLKEKNNTYNEDNDASSDDDTENSSDRDSSDEMPVDIINGDVFLEDEDPSEEATADAKTTLGSINGEKFTLSQLLDRQFLYSNFYIVDSATTTNDDLFNAKKLVNDDLALKKNSKEPQILIYHTHSQETYVDSRAGVEGDTVVGVGSYLTKILEDKYGFNVIHDTSKYDMKEGYLERNLAYNYACDGIEEILEDNPSIEVVIDLHRDGVSDDLPKGEGKRVANINGKDTAQVMLFNGLSRNSKGEISRLKNPYLQDNLAFSLQIQLKGRELYSGLMYKNYLHAYRYNMHLRKRSLLMEVGTNRNTVQEAKNAMVFIAEVITDVLSGE